MTTPNEQGGLKPMEEQIARIVCPIYWDLLDQHPSGMEYWFRRREQSLETARQILALPGLALLSGEGK